MGKEGGFYRQGLKGVDEFSMWEGRSRGPAGWAGEPAGHVRGAGRPPMSGAPGRPPLGQAEKDGVLADFGGLFGLVRGPFFSPKDTETQV